MQMLSRQEVVFRMPKFKLETSLVLDKALKKMGIYTAYTPTADFKGISAMGPLQLGTVKQKCYIDVTEKGTEAAAVTSVQVRLTSASPKPVARMTVDRPFLFIISDTQTDNILFVGKVVNL
jgi:serpin B